jgi:hypothetical protein
MSGVKRASFFLVPYALAFILICAYPPFLHRRDFDRAFFAYYRDPTPANATTLRAQQRINGYFYLGFAAVGALGFVSLGYGIYVVARLADHGIKRIRGSNSQS